LKGIGDFKLLPKSVSIPTIPGTAWLHQYDLILQYVIIIIILI
jgi:hypothetical protein